MKLGKIAPYNSGYNPDGMTNEEFFRILNEKLTRKPYFHEQIFQINPSRSSERFEEWRKRRLGVRYEAM